MSRWRAAAALLLLVACWAATTPAGSAPDERAHHIKALAAGHAEFSGRRSRVVLRSTYRFALAARSTRVFPVPAKLVEATFACNRKHPEVSAACLHATPATGTVERSTYIGTYPPYLYAPAGLVGRLAGTPIDALMWERFVFAAVAAALLALSALVVGRDGDHRVALLVLLAAATPMVLFLAGSLNTSGVHIASTLAFAAIVFAAARHADGLRSVWLPAGIAGAVAILSRPEGVLWIGLCLLVYLLLGGRRLPVGLLALLALAFAAVVVWQVHTGARATRFGTAELGLGAGDVWHRSRALLEQVVGNFGWLDSPLPRWLYAAWFAAAAIASGFALAVANWRQRLALVIGPAVAVVMTIVFQTVVVGPWAFTRQLVQARYAMPALLMGVLVIGEIVDRRGTVSPRALRAAAIAIGLLNVAALVTYWRRNAVGTRGTWLFVMHSQWQPPLGWWPWTIVAVGVVVLLGTAGLTPPSASPRLHPSTRAACS